MLLGRGMKWVNSNKKIPLTGRKFILQCLQEVFGISLSFFSYFIFESDSSPVAYLAVANLTQREILVHC